MTEGSSLEGAGTVTLSFSANMRFVRPIRHFISALCALAKYAEEDSDAIALVTTEILNNSIEHGSGSPADEIGVTMTVTPELFRFEVIDPGKGGADFAREAPDKAKAMPDFEEPRGRGLFLISNYMDQFDVSYEPERGTRVLVSKSRTP